MMYALLIALSAYLGLKCVTYNVKIKGILWYMVEKKYTSPTKEELEKCNQRVLICMIDDLFRH